MEITCLALRLYQCVHPCTSSLHYMSGNGRSWIPMGVVTHWQMVNARPRTQRVDVLVRCLIVSGQKQLCLWEDWLLESAAQPPEDVFSTAMALDSWTTASELGLCKLVLSTSIGVGGFSAVL